jgi:uncharacterized protein (UPF0333 family)
MESRGGICQAELIQAILTAVKSKSQDDVQNIQIVYRPTIVNMGLNIFQLYCKINYEDPDRASKKGIVSIYRGEVVDIEYGMEIPEMIFSSAANLRPRN